MTKAAVEAVAHVFREGFKYSRAEVLLLGLCQQGEYTDDLFAATQPLAMENVMGVSDAINGRWGCLFTIAVLWGTYCAIPVRTMMPRENAIQASSYSILSSAWLRNGFSFHAWRNAS
jgi:hypothetical protein